MVLTQSDLLDKQQIRDQLGSGDNKFEIIKRFVENVKCEELSTKITTGNIGTAGIWGHPEPINGYWGTCYWTSGTVTFPQTLKAVTNPNNTFKDYFRNDNFIGTSTTATIDVANFKITF